MLTWQPRRWTWRCGARPQPGLILHSDRSGEFANATFQRRASEAKLRLSMSWTGNCYDNAAAESFFAAVKLETLPEGIFASRQEAKAAAAFEDWVRPSGQPRHHPTGTAKNRG